MVSLVQDVESIPNNKVTVTAAIKQWHAFALNRRNRPGDRDKALLVIQQVNQQIVKFWPIWFINQRALCNHALSVVRCRRLSTSLSLALALSLHTLPSHRVRHKKFHIWYEYANIYLLHAHQIPYLF